MSKHSGLLARVPKLTSTHPKIKLSGCKLIKEGLGIMKRINTIVKSTYQSSINVECIGLAIIFVLMALCWIEYLLKL